MIKEVLSFVSRIRIHGIASALSSIARSASFSQFAEDIFASKLMNFGENGFYVDVGAAYPILNSNTYRFYLKGWRGLTIEPNPDLVFQQRRVRPGDVCVPVGIAASEGTLTYYRFTPADYNTFDPELAEQLVARGIRSQSPLVIPTRTLSSILDEYVRDRAIDIMSIDCEGLDLEVVQSSDWKRFRPRLLMVEDHQPSLSAAINSRLTKFLAAADYVFVARLSYTSFFVPCEEIHRLPGNESA